MGYKYNPFTGELDIVSSSSSGSGTTEFDGNSGSAFPVGGVINIVGGGSLTTSGAGNTLTISDGLTSLDFDTDSGAAAVSANTINLDGGTNINTSGTGSSVTINLDSTISITSATIGGINVTSNQITSVNVNENIVISPNGIGSLFVPYLSQFGVLSAGTSGEIQDLGVLTNGQLLIGSTGNFPVKSSLTSTGGSVTITSGAGSINLEAAADVGATDFLTNFGTAIESSGNISLLGGSNVNTSGAGSAVTINLDSTISITSATIGGINVTSNQITSVNVNEDIVISPNGIGTVFVPYLSQFGVLSAGTSGEIQDLGVMSSGQLLIGSTGNFPVKASLTSTGGSVTITSGAGSINLEAASSGTSWSVETGATAAISANEGIFSNNAGGVTITLPVTATVGDTFQVVAMDAAGFTIDYGTGQSIQISGTTSTVTSGTLVSSGEGDWVEIICNVANTGFMATVRQGNISVT